MDARFSAAPSIGDTCRSFRALDSQKRVLLLEAAALVAALPLALRIAPFGRLRRVLGACAAVRCNRNASPPLVAWAVEAAAARLSREGSCLVRALAADLMLRRRGYRPRLHIGVRRSGSARLEGHAWLEWDGSVIVGEVDHLEDYARLPATEIRG